MCLSLSLSLYVCVCVFNTSAVKMSTYGTVLRNTKFGSCCLLPFIEELLHEMSLSNKSLFIQLIHPSNRNLSLSFLLWMLAKLLINTILIFLKNYNIRLKKFDWFLYLITSSMELYNKMKKRQKTHLYFHKHTFINQYQNKWTQVG